MIIKKITNENNNNKNNKNNNKNSHRACPIEGFHDSHVGGLKQLIKQFCMKIDLLSQRREN